jgi:hypothetical protein
MKTPRIIITTFSTLMIATVLGLGSAFGDTVEKKAQETFIPSFVLKEVTASDALKAISTQTGIKVFFVPPKNNTNKLTVSLKNVPASEALKYVTLLANLKFTYEEDGVHVTSM